MKGNTVTDRDERRKLRELRAERRAWKTCVGLDHFDYCLAPGTPEGDAATAYRADRVAELDRQIKELAEPAEVRPTITATQDTLW